VNTLALTQHSQIANEAIRTREAEETPSPRANATTEQSERSRLSATPGSTASNSWMSKPRAKDPTKFSGPSGDITYKIWKTLVYDKFEIDAQFFPLERDLMYYILNCTEGEPQEHLFPRYSRECAKEDRYHSSVEMFETLDAIYLDPHEARKAKVEYEPS
jgi:hypothetical protein